MKTLTQQYKAVLYAKKDLDKDISKMEKGDDRDFFLDLAETLLDAAETIKSVRELLSSVSALRNIPDEEL